MDDRGIDAIGRTAFETALLRALEHRRPDRLFADPCARTFLEAAGIGDEVPAHKRDFAAVLGPQVAVRTRFLDDVLLTATSGGCRQVVLVASGMDARPWRLDWPAGTEVFELDQEPVLRFKHAVAPASSAVRPVAADLRGDWALALREAGFDTGRPTAWLTEGLLYAWDEAGADRLLATISELSAPGSVIAFDHLESSEALRAAIDAIDPHLASLWQPGPADPARWLTRHGWKPDVSDLDDVAAAYGRKVHPAYDRAAGGTSRAWLGRATG